MLSIFKKNESFDDLLEKVSPEFKQDLLVKVFLVDLAKSWLDESGLRYEASDVLRLAELLGLPK